MLKVYILSEAGKNVGFGHLMRMMGIYQAFETKNIIPTFIINGDQSVEEYLKDIDYKVFNWLDERDRLYNMIKDADIAIIDSYLADEIIYENISKLVKLPVYYDDNNRIEYPEGVIVNGNIYAKELDYPKKTGRIYLLGLEYLPLRKEFWDVPEKKVREKVETIMVTFGGDDSRNMTPKVLKILADNHPHVKKNVIIGKGFNNIKEIEEASDENTALIYFPDAQKMKEVMIESDIAISAGGQTLYELARVGVPTIAVIVAENQLGNVTNFLCKNLIYHSEFYNDLNLNKNIKKSVFDLFEYEKRARLNIMLGNQLDGLGQNRLIEHLMEICG